MAYVAPTAASIKVLYPEFAAVADATIDAKIAQSLRWVDDSWIEDDRNPAMSAWVAAELQAAGLGTNAKFAAAKAAGVSRVKSGDLEFSFAGGTGSSGYGIAPSGASSPYYADFLAYLRRSKPAVGIV